MKKIIMPMLLMLGIGHAPRLVAQVDRSAQQAALQQIARPGSTAEWLQLKPSVRISAVDFFSKTRQALGLTEQDEMVFQRTDSDNLGMLHHRYLQYASGVPVIGAEYILHEEKGNIVSANGKLAHTAAAPAGNAISENDAIETAMKLSPSGQFLWLDETSEKTLQESTGDLNASNFPVVRKVWIRENQNGPWNSTNLKLAWEVPVYTTDGQSATYYIEVYSGRPLHIFPISLHCDPGSGATTWNGTQNLPTDQSSGNFILLDDCQSPNIHVFNANDSTSTAFASEYTDADNNWTGQTSAYQTFYGLHRAWRYYLNVHGRNSYDGAGANINAYNQAGFGSPSTLNWSNACWDCISNSVNFGDNGTDGTAADDWNTLDIVGHELTHGVTEFSAGLIYNQESGALNESFSDIFGEMVELDTEGSLDWLVGNDRGAIRSFINPNNFGDPDTYQGGNWVFPNLPCNGNNDQCGVHTNSGVQNYWFYLLSTGGTGYNDNGDYFEVQGIGTAGAAAIAYRNLTVYLTGSSNYADAKDGAIQAAADIFGACSNEVLQCARAWNAVGVNSSDVLGYDIDVDCGFLNLAHALLLPLNYDAFNEIWSDCDIVPNSTLVEFKAGHAITLEPGFRSGDDFHAYIDPCTMPKPALAPSVVAENRQIENAPTSDHTTMDNLMVFPNPFAESVNVQFSLDAQNEVTLVLLDHLGREVYRWYDNTVLEPGSYKVKLENAPVAAGIYFVSLRTASGSETRKLVKSAD